MFKLTPPDVQNPVRPRPRPSPSRMSDPNREKEQILTFNKSKQTCLAFFSHASSTALGKAVSVCWLIRSNTSRLQRLNNFQIQHTGNFNLASLTSTDWHKHLIPHRDTGDPPVFTVEPLSQQLLIELWMNCNN